MKVLAILSTAGCVIAGIWLLTTQPAESNSLFGPWMHAMGLYFIAKGLYVGPSLISQAEASRSLRWIAKIAQAEDERPG